MCMKNEKELEKELAKIDHWKYIAIHTKNGWGIYEGCFDKKGKRIARTENTISLNYFDTKEELVETLLTMLKEIE